MLFDFTLGHEHLCILLLFCLHYMPHVPQVPCGMVGSTVSPIDFPGAGQSCPLQKLRVELEYLEPIGAELEGKGTAS